MRRLFVLLVSAVMALTLIAVAAGVSAAAPKQQAPQPGPNDSYGALYASNTKGALFWGTGASKAAAVRKASASCQAKDCDLFIWVKNGWVAFSQGRAKNGRGFEWFGTWGRTEKAVVADSMRNCRLNATRCELVGTYETAFDPKQPTKGGFTK
jgi:hypothetical protein